MADQKKKLELELNIPVNLELLYEKPVIGNSQFGKYYMYNMKNGTGDVVFFAPPEVHEKLKELKKGDKVTITKVAEREQKGSKVVIKYDVAVSQTLVNNLPKELATPEPTQTPKDNYFVAMLSSYEDAMKIQEKLNGMVDVNRIAITLFIARSKLNGYGMEVK